MSDDWRAQIMSIAFHSSNIRAYNNNRSAARNDEIRLPVWFRALIWICGGALGWAPVIWLLLAL
jgi:hypothetical protein